ncbi:uncharacterized protein VP01_1571g3 [Puccinia sorghi]|uniref:Uncharacterized protein n=1 Tax=Puccinia sorghi TaxID=27349 RepID=A0A0L6VHR7_9BASI|nr:uncharacterized protein VP01_1571g3 [Puccinia sorghi]
MTAEYIKLFSHTGVFALFQVFLTCLSIVIGNPNNHHTNGTVCLDPDSLGVILRMMEAKSSRLIQMDQMLHQLWSQTCTPPPKSVLKSLKPGKADIYHDPTKGISDNLSCPGLEIWGCVFFLPEQAPGPINDHQMTSDIRLLN